MAEYILVNNYSGLGKMGISRKTIASITSKAVASVKGVSLPEDDLSSSKGKKKKNVVQETINSLFKVQTPIHVIVRKDGKVDINIEVSIKQSADVAQTCLQIQKAVTEAIQMSCETVPFSVNVTVVKLN